MSVHTTRWSVPGIGIAWPCLDRVEIISSRSVGFLKHCLPIGKLEAASHAFNIIRYDGPDSRLSSRVVVVGTHATDPFSILLQHEADLGSYRITKAELAFDVDATAIDEARTNLFELVKLID